MQQNIEFERCMDFLVRMIDKYVAEVLLLHKAGYIDVIGNVIYHALHTIQPQMFQISHSVCADVRSKQLKFSVFDGSAHIFVRYISGKELFYIGILF